MPESQLSHLKTHILVNLFITDSDYNSLVMKHV